MNKVKINLSRIHYFIIQYMVNNGFAPRISEIASHFQIPEERTILELQALQDYHGVVLHPYTSEVWVIHPFSNAPTNCYLKSERGSWWSSCIWCALGAAALIKEDLSISTTIGAESKKVVIEIKKGKILNPNLYVHFPIPMKNAWDNVVYTCSTMLLFEKKDQIKDWSQRHNIPIGDIQPINLIWEFSKKWYRNHLNSDWKKWTVEEARKIFREFGLKHKIWDLENSSERF
ncbi:MAG: hypothetical protein D8M58_17885 [Calditrichaeota bacterium]|nr:MAG: hypothetical protein DWQ03_01800 [Calditrichota bacterium]MBL1207279.1 hypothetical protein [Calditrichota bacterium]NOG47111.1 hypothetical protein [Calditrichota bacterium]